MSKRVVITGMGVLSPCGIGLEKYWDNLINGNSGISKINTFDVEKFPSKIAGLVNDFDPHDFIDKKDARRMDRFIQFGVAAAIMALEDSSMKIESSNANQVGVIVGSGIGGLYTLERQHEILLNKGPSRVSPFLVPMMICDLAAGQISINLGAKGPNSCVVTACSSASNSIGEAYETILRGDAEAIITGGSEAGVTPLGLAGFCSMRALSTRNDEPEKASRPFDRDRDGFVIAEGAGIIILENLESALAREAKIYAEIVGYGSTGDAYHITAPSPDGEGAARAIQMALDKSGLNNIDIDYINAHGTSTPFNDELETIAVKKVFGEKAYQIPISSTKSMTGHLLGASGAIEFIATVLAMEKKIIPPTINLDNPDPKCDLDYVPNQSREKEVKTAITNSFGFGGHNASLLIKKYED